MFGEFVCYLLSIGLSDAIELYLNPMVHKIHNAPDIIGKNWVDYTIGDAFFSGIIASWPVIIPMIICYVFTIYPIMLLSLSFINLSIPIICYLTNWQTEDLFLAHKILYILGFIYFGSLMSIYMLYSLYQTFFNIGDASHHLR